MPSTINTHWIQLFAMTFGSMMTWGHMIWIFFPIPVFCLLLLSLPSGIQRFEKFGTQIVGRIFFTRVSVGGFYVRLVYFFICVSMIIFGMAGRTIQAGFGSAHVPCSGTSCPYHGGETMWYRRASRHRAERNFWLSLFTLTLWLLVYNIYMLKEQIVRLRSELKDELTKSKVNATNADETLKKIGKLRGELQEEKAKKEKNGELKKEE